MSMFLRATAATAELRQQGQNYGVKLQRQMAMRVQFHLLLDYTCIRKEDYGN